MAAFITLRKRKVYHKRRDTKENDYKMLHRFEETNVEKMAKLFLGTSFETRGGALTSKLKMEIFLRYMADPGYQIGVGEGAGVHRTTVCKTVKTVIEKMILHIDDWIQFPNNVESIHAAKLDWSAKFKFPNTLGAIDCTHVPIPKPKDHGEEYINRKGFTSINVQATCNAKEVFTSVDVRWPGSVHDSRVLRTSALYSFMNTSSMSYTILGDSGYGIHPRLMTPFKNPTTDKEKNYNKIHAQERVIIERCFGQLKRRFPILKYGVRTALIKVPQIILICFMLHNIAKHLQDNDFNMEDESNGDDYEIEDDEYSANEVNMRREGVEKRIEISNMLFRMRNQ